MKVSHTLVITVIISSLLGLSGCHWDQRYVRRVSERQEERMIKKEEIAKNVADSFEAILSYYPTPDIDDLLDESMGNQVILQTDINHQQNKNTPLISEGMILYVNTSTKKGYGYYHIDKIGPESRDKKQRYPVTYDRGIHLCKSTGNEELDQKIKHFQFLCQWADFNGLTEQPVIDASYQSEVPMFSADYQLLNNNPLVRKLRRVYYFTQKEAPIVHLSGIGHYGESPECDSSDERNIDIYFSKKPLNSVYSSITYNNKWKEEKTNSCITM